MSSTDGYTPPNMTPGSPESAYQLSGFDTIDPATRRLNFRLVLHTMQGRGGMTLPIVLKLSANWQGKAVQQPYNCGQQGCQYEWRYFAIPSWWSSLDPPYAPGYAEARPAAAYPTTIDGTTVYQYTNTQITVAAPDGTEYDLRDEPSRGRAKTGPVDGRNRGSVFVSVDGGGATFISHLHDASQTRVDIYDRNSPSGAYPVTGTLFLRDGTRYRIEDGKISRITDRNGNYFDIAYDEVDRVSTITDTVGRTVHIAYADPASAAECSDPDCTADRITYTGSDGTDRTISVYRTLLASRLRSGIQISNRTDMFYSLPCGSGCDTAPHSPSVVAAVQVPSNDPAQHPNRFEFRYNEYGEVAQVRLPTGGGYEYDYSRGTQNPQNSSQWTGGADLVMGGVEPYYVYIERHVNEKRVYGQIADGTATNLIARTTFGSVGCGVGCVQMETEDAAGTLLTATRHYYISLAQLVNWDPTSYPVWTVNREFKTESLATDRATTIQRVEHEWQQRDASGEPEFVDDVQTSRLHDPRISQTDTTWVPQNKFSRQTFEYDAYNNKTETWEYDWGTGTSPGPLLRKTVRSFLQTGYDTVAAQPDITSHIRDLVSTETISDDNGTAGRSEYYYDGATESSSSPIPAVGNLGAYGHDDTVFGTSWARRGNLTRIRKLKEGSTYISMNRTYDVNGNLLSSTDALQNTANFEYADCFGGTGEPPGSKPSFAFVTTLRLPAARSGQSRLSEGYCYNYHLGRPTSHTDANGNATLYGYGDALDRLKSVTAPGDGATTIYDYVDGPNPSVTARRDKDTVGAGEIWSEALYDGLGRASGTRQSAKAGTVITSTVYDGLNRKHQVSYPAYGSAGALTTHDYDTLGRVTGVCTSDGACTTTSYEGPVSIVTDAASNQRRLETDALGRLTAVTEAYATAAASTTYYRYDALANLKRVCQGGTFTPDGESCTGGQLRRFEYDMLGRLTSAQNPESGLTSYGYDDNGNLTSRVMADGAALGIDYDNLNRPWRKTYSGPRSTPQVTLCYDGEVYSAATSDCAPASPIGNANMRLTEVRTSESSTKYTGYHERGFVAGLEQTTDGSGPYVFSNFTYNLAGVLTGINYPSGRRLTYGVDAAGLVDSISGQSVTYGSIAYAAHGVPNSITFGNGLVETWQHSAARLQPEWVKLGTTGQPDSIGKVRIAYCPAGFGTSCTTNNGNVLSEGIKIGASEVARGYRYDAFSRLALSVEDGNANETTCASAGGRRCEHFGYDVFGNRRILDRSADLTASLSEPTAFDGNNRATGGSWRYDAAGNLDRDGAGMAMTYDGEGRVKTAGTWEYVYDGEGRRVLKRNGTGSRTVYVYGPDGELAAEYSTEAPQVSGVQYVSVDWLGSTRIVTGPAGEVQERTDYLPFGAVVGFGGSDPRSGQAGYGNDVLAQKFTGKERDSESGLDYFGARYFSGAQGRFTSTDEFPGGIVDAYSGGQVEVPGPLPYADIGDPQTLNKYVYVRNNPLRYVDPDGHQPGEPGLVEEVIDATMEEVDRVARPLIESAGRQASPILGVLGKGLTLGLGLLSFQSSAAGSQELQVEKLIGEGKTFSEAYTIVFGPPTQPKAAPGQQPTGNPPGRIAPSPQSSSEHTKGARPSTKQPHQEGKARKKKDRGGEKGDKLPLRKRPKNWNGKWPPDPGTRWW